MAYPPRNNNQARNQSAAKTGPKTAFSAANILENGESFLTQKQIAELNKGIADENLYDRKGSTGKNFKYTVRDYLAATLTRIFGVDNWSRETIQTEIIDTREDFYTKIKDGKPVTYKGFTCAAIAKVRLTVHFRSNNEVHTSFFEGIGGDAGICDKAGATAIGELLVNTMKSAETDAFKRACKDLGHAFGQQIDVEFSESPEYLEAHANIADQLVDAGAARAALPAPPAHPVALPISGQPQPRAADAAPPTQVQEPAPMAAPTRQQIDPIRLLEMPLDAVAAYLSNRLAGTDLNHELIRFRTSSAQCTNPDLESAEWSKFYTELRDQMAEDSKARNVSGIIFHALKINAIRDMVVKLDSPTYTNWYNHAIKSYLVPASEPYFKHMPDLHRLVELMRLPDARRPEAKPKTLADA